MVLEYGYSLLLSRVPRVPHLVRSWGVRTAATAGLGAAAAGWLSGRGGRAGGKANSGGVALVGGARIRRVKALLGYGGCRGRGGADWLVGLGRG